MVQAVRNKLNTFTITPDTSYFLAAAAAFGFGPNTGRPKPEGNVMRLAFVTDDFGKQVGVLLQQDAAGTITASVQNATKGAAVASQVKRILSLDHSGTQWLKVGKRDPVLGKLQRQHPGMRPVLFHSPYEAAAWSIISARRHRNQATAVRRRLAQKHGRVFQIGGESVEAFPTPRQLLAVRSFPGIDATRIARLHAVAAKALEGKLDPSYLLSMPATEALEELQTLPGIGPLYAGLILLRSTGTSDIVTLHEPRMASYIAHFYKLKSGIARPAQIERLSEKWRPFRTWAAVLIRVAGDRANVSWQAEPKRRKPAH